MNIGLYFGSFNPIHNGHLIIANHVLNESPVQKLWFVVSPQNPFKDQSTLLNEFDRLYLVQSSIEDDPRLKATDIEFYLSKPSYTVNTLVHLEEKYPGNNFSIIMGSDSFQNIEHWKNFEAILKNYPVIVYRRPGFEIEKTHHAKLTILDAPLLQISSTAIRKTIREGKSIRYLVPEKAREEIERNRYYKK